MSNATHAPKLWILHRDEARRGALARAVGGAAGARISSPADTALATAALPDVIVLGLDGDIEPEFEFAHRNAARLAPCAWVLVTNDHEADDIRRRFDVLAARVVAAPYSARELRQEIRSALAAQRRPDSLSLRQYRDHLSERFIRWFEDLLGVDDLELLQAMDPKLASVPLLVRGEPGSGRALFARYIHTFGGDAAGGNVPFVEIDCAATTREDTLLESIGRVRSAASATVFLQRPEELPAGLHGRLVEWIEYGLPPAVLPGTRVRWVASLLPETELGGGQDWLTDALSGLNVSLPPLRQRSNAIAPFVRATAVEWSRAAGRRLRTFAPEALEALELYSWPGNLRELEGVVVRALASFAADPIEIRHLRIADATPELDGSVSDQSGQIEDAASDIIELTAEREVSSAGSNIVALTPEHEAPGSGADIVELNREHEAFGEDPDIVQLTPAHEASGGSADIVELNPEREAFGEDPDIIQLTPEHDAFRGSADIVQLTPGHEVPSDGAGASSGEFERWVGWVNTSWHGLPGNPSGGELPGAGGGRAGGWADDETSDHAEMIDSLLGELHRASPGRQTGSIVKHLERQKPLVAANRHALRRALHRILETAIARSEATDELEIGSQYHPAESDEPAVLQIRVVHRPASATPSDPSAEDEAGLAQCEILSEQVAARFSWERDAGGGLSLHLDLQAAV